MIEASSQQILDNSRNEMAPSLDWTLRYHSASYISLFPNLRSTLDEKASSHLD
jgi:hypothetical protein